MLYIEIICINDGGIDHKAFSEIYIIPSTSINLIKTNTHKDSSAALMVWE